MAEIDLGIAAGLAVSVGDEMEKRLDRHRMRWLHPVWLHGSALSSSTTAATFIDLGPPPPEHIWDLRTLVISQLNPYGAQVNYPSAIYVTSTEFDSPQPGHIVDVAQNLPVAFHYGTAQVFVRDPEHLIVGVLTGAQPFQLYVRAMVILTPIREAKI